MTGRRKKVCGRCHKKGLFRDAKQKYCTVCEHQIRGVEKKEFGDKMGWDE